MGNVDCTSKVFVQKPEVFCDVFKLVLNDAKTSIRELKTMEPDAFFAQKLPGYGETKRARRRRKAQKALMLTRFSRDIIKSCICGTDECADYVIMAIENQSYVDDLMPARLMIYDAMTLHTQLEVLKAQKWPKSTSEAFLTGIPRGVKLKPVMTVVCYFGTKPWDGPCNLHEIYDIKNPKMKTLIPNYPIMVIDPHTLTDDQLQLLDTSLREVFMCIKAGHDRKMLKEIVHSSPRFQHMDADAVNLVKAALNIDIHTKSNQQEINMCQAVEEWKQELLAEGKAEGKAESLLHLMKNFKLSLEQAFIGLSIPENEWDKYRQLIQQMQV